MTRARRHIWFAGALALAACEAESRPTAKADTSGSQWEIVPGHVGPITGQINEAELRQRYPNAVEATRVQLGEGETAPGAVLFPQDSLGRAEIIWRDTLTRARPSRIVLRGDRSRWRLSRGISLGTTLQELERLNGTPFTLAGFGWDYAGVITDWQGGSLDSALAGIKLYLDPGPAQYQSAAYSKVLGDRDYASSMPAMQQLNPKVTQIFVDFDQP